MGKLKCGLIQMGLKGDVSMGPEKIRDRMLEAHLPLIDKAGAAGVQVLCFQEIFTQPYFCPSQDRKWYAAAEAVPDGYTTRLMQEHAKKYRMVMVVPVYEEAMTGVYYNTAAVIDADGKYLGKYRKTHIPQVDPGFYEKFFFKPGDLGYPVFQTAYVNGSCRSWRERTGARFPLLSSRSSLGCMDTKRVSRIKSAELMSAVGAGFLGAGLALLLRERLGAFAVPILVGGLVAHAFGMYLKHQWEKDLRPLPAWINALYWACWVLLAGLTAFIVVR